MDSAGSKTLAWSVTDYGMTHIAIQGSVGGRNVDWMEKVSAEEYKMTQGDG